MKELLKPSLDSSDGTFWMEISDFFLVFNTFSACIGRPDWSYVQQSVKFTKTGDIISSPSVRIEIPEGAVLD